MKKQHIHQVGTVERANELLDSEDKTRSFAFIGTLPAARGLTFLIVETWEEEE